ncbi:hypothetical protein RF11_03248 [Thelohanellus kitauei]|uniref:Uncharacterized protein n=1 Tax=Thelohanellus kitauei TaxID=669202 RepID=A0A0C2JP59_THEKT|nr:hypothetical protein RF11_03248 [Thelohanellus kitauei]
MLNGTMAMYVFIFMAIALDEIYSTPEEEETRVETKIKKTYSLVLAKRQKQFSALDKAQNNKLLGDNKGKFDELLKEYVDLVKSQKMEIFDNLIEFLLRTHLENSYEIRQAIILYVMKKISGENPSELSDLSSEAQNDLGIIGT